MSTMIEFALCFCALISPFIPTATSSAFLAPITKDLSTQKHTMTIYLNTPPRPTNLLLDIGASFTLLDCPRAAQFYDSLTTRKPQPIMGRPTSGSLSMPVTDGVNPGRLGLVPGFVFSCSSGERSSIKGAKGFAGMGRSNLSIPVQISRSSSGSAVFALCLSGSASAPGVAFFGSSGPYYFLPGGIDLSKHLNHTPLLVGSTANEYFIRLTSVKVNGKNVDFNPTLLSIDGKGYGGTKLSTVTPYTELHSSIFKALSEAFVNESAALNLTVTDPVRPFRVCYRVDDVTSGQVGPGVPTIDFVMQDSGVTWRIFGSNSMVRIYNRNGTDVWCLGILDGGAHPKTSIVIGGHQMEDNLLQFDLEKEVLGFSSSVLVHGTMCANFNFTTDQIKT